jgi:hypothetical protein
VVFGISQAEGAWAMGVIRGGMPPGLVIGAVAGGIVGTRRG